MLLPFQGATAPTRGTQGVASLALGYVLHWAFSPPLLNPKLKLLAVAAFVCNSYLYPDARRVAPISACVFSQRLSGRANLNLKVELKTVPLARAHLGTSTAYLCNVNKNSRPPPLRLRTDMSPW